MDQIDIIGFDLDYTIAEYNNRLQELVYNHARDYMVNTLHYPSTFKDTVFDASFANRGITFDKSAGILLKMDSSNRIAQNSVFRGRTRLSLSEIKAFYKSQLRAAPGDPTWPLAFTPSS
jgi:hypothetical protein